DQYGMLRPNEPRAKKLADLCRNAHPNDHATLLAFEAELTEQQSWPLADGVLDHLKLGTNAAAVRKQLLAHYQQRVEKAWRGLGTGLGMAPSGEYSFGLENRKEVNDLPPLKGIPLTRLSLYNCGPVRDLLPLHDMRLTSLILLNCDQVRDLAPLRGMPL